MGGGEHKFARTKLARLDEDGTFSGYASLFGKEDLGHDVMMKGAFQKSLSKNGARAVRMLFQHDPDKPIGVWDIIREDEKGLYVKGRLTLAVERAREVYALMKEGGLNGLSIGFKTVKGKRDSVRGQRLLYEVDLWEISVVTFPMLPKAQVDTVKSVLKPNSQLPSLREFERWLTQDAGLSRKQARVVIHSGYHNLKAMREAASEITHKTAANSQAFYSIKKASADLQKAIQSSRIKGQL